jgi:PAS domain S-box-containing protein
MTERIRLLICEDSDDDAVLIVRTLVRGGFEVFYERAATAAATAEALRARPPDLVISDYSMPGFGAEAALALLRESGLDVPFIVVSGRVGEELAAALMRSGAHDFILKGSTARLVPVVRRELRQAQARRERRTAQEALRQSESRFRLIAEHAPDVLFRCQLRPRREVEYVSPAASVVFGRPPQELCGDPEVFFSAALPEDRERLEASWLEPRAQPLTVRWKRPDGAMVWTEQRVVALRDDTGRIIAVEGILRDITDRVRADQEREQLQQQLRQAERLESLGRLAGGIAHDFNNLLTLILGRADLALADLSQDSALRADLDIIRRLAERGGALTRRLLVFSRQAPLNPQTFDINEAVADTERVLRGAIGEDVEFVVDLDPTPCHVLIDRGELERLLLNLIANARRAMPDGGKLTVRTARVTQGREDDHRDEVRLTVSDTGTGVLPDVAKHVFEPFFTTDSATGTGLGLAMAYGVVKQAGGKISLRSEVGEGTTVLIELPAAEPSDTAAEGTQRSPRTGDGRTVIVVEDDDDIRDLVTLMLRRSGYNVLAASPQSAVDLAMTRDSPIDVLLTDVVMPEVSGLELARRVREARPAMPILFMSGHTGGALADDAFQAPATALIRKPFAASALLAALDQLLDR